MKQNRHQKIAELVSRYEIETQEELAEKLKEAGFVAYLVGGGVRDRLLKRTPKDFDISTSARPEQIKQVF